MTLIKRSNAKYCSLLIFLLILIVSKANAYSNISSCTVISSPGYYVLTQDIINSTASTCIEITSNDVVLDGQGHRIDGVDLDRSRGVYVHDVDNVTIKNLRITDWGEGIVIRYMSRSTISNNILSRNSEGVVLWASLNNSISANTFTNNYEAILIASGSNYNIISGNVIINNMEGIRLEFNINNFILNNTISNNVLYGIQITYGLFGQDPNHLIYNNYLNNSNNIDNLNKVNFWNISKTPGRNIVGGPYLGGNFWANPSGTGFSQTCNDTDMDGICDDPYVIDENNTDYLPLSLYMPTSNPSHISHKVPLLSLIHI